jgi:hypothetical protein
MSTRIPCNSHLALALVLTAALAGCNGNSIVGGTDGTLNLSVTDTPVDGAQSVVVAITGVDLMGPGGQHSFTFSPARSLDILKLQGNVSQSLLAGVSVPSGNYQWLRLGIDPANSYLVTSTGARFPLSMPSGSESGLKLARGFAVGSGNVADFMIDFDLRKSVIQSTSGGVTGYTLKPTLRLSDLQQAGSISGTVSPSLSIGGTLITDPSCSPAVYVYQGADAHPIIGYTYPAPYFVTFNTEQPLASAAVSLDATSGDYTYTVGFLDSGTYTVAVTCAAMDKLPNPDVLTTVWLSFSATQNATVTADNTTTINF